ncbi:MAG: hypothetical protein ABJA10_04875 [Aestuariivirga sp.]
MVINKHNSKAQNGVNPEAIAKFAQSARAENGKRARTGVGATSETTAIPTDPKLQHSAATKVLREAAIGDDEGSEELIKQLPDPILDHH